MISIVLSIMVPLFMGVLLSAWLRPSWLRSVVVVVGGLVHVGVIARLIGRTAGQTIEVVALGGWRMPMGIALTIDHLAALLMGVASVLVFAASMYTLGEEKESLAHHYHATQPRRSKPST